MTGPSPAAKRRRSPIGSMGNSRSAKMIAASTSSSSTGCKVTVAARSGRLQISRIPCRSRIWRYCRRYRPACRINQTGLTSVGRRRQASRKRLVMGATRMGNQNKTITNCLNLGLIFGSAARFFRPFDQKIDPAVSIRVAIPLKMQLGDVPEAEPDAQLVTQVVPGVVQRSQRLPLALLIPAGRDLDVGMPAIRAEMHLGNVHFQNPRILHLEPDDFGKLFPDSLRDPQCAPLIHKATAPLRSRLGNTTQALPCGRGSVTPATLGWHRPVPNRAKPRLRPPRSGAPFRRRYGSMKPLPPLRWRAAKDPGNRSRPPRR